MNAVDLRSDTVTRPGPLMRRAIAEAEVGDDVLGDDPTVLALQREVARLLGKEEALYFPSGTQANEAAVCLHAGRGDEAIVEYDSHLFTFEGGGPAALAGVQLHPLRGEAGLLTRRQIEAAVRPRDPHFAQTRLVCFENTHNSAGGRVLPLEAVEEAAAFCRERGIAVHLDGARLWNAAAAAGVSPARVAAPADTVMVSLSKGLGAPVGSCLAGSAAHVERARWWRKRLGGGMRQAGLLAAAGLWALAHHLERLPEDHRLARRLAEGLAGLPHLRVDPSVVETNIVLIFLDESGPSAEELQARLDARGVRLLANGPRVLRAVTHLDVDAAGIERAVEEFGRALRPSSI